MHGRYTVEFLSQDGTLPLTKTCRDRAFTGSRGWDNMINRQWAEQHKLAAQSRLAGNCLRLRITVTLAP